ncbi:MAG: Gfo/Idh/MocA family protein, partial [Spirochaetota bacterium]
MNRDRGAGAVNVVPEDGSRSSRRDVPGVLLLGAGDRGRTYAEWIRRHPSRLRLVALAEPRERVRDELAAAHRIPESRRYSDWATALAAERAVDGVIIALQDRLHRDAALAALARPVHVLLEKPMATTREEVLEIAAAGEQAREGGGSLTLCHVLRCGITPGHRQGR